MTMYYEMIMEVDNPCWSIEVKDHFPDGSKIDIWAYMRCEMLEAPQPVPLEVQEDGPQVDFNPTAFSAIVVSSRMADIIESVSPTEIQRIPALIDAPGDWEVLNILSCVDCIDRERSIIKYFEPDRPIRPNKPRDIPKLVLDEEKAEGHHIFHPKDWEVAEIVSEEVKMALEACNITGIEYWPVEISGNF